MPTLELFEKPKVSPFSYSQTPGFWANIVRIVEVL